VNINHLIISEQLPPHPAYVEQHEQDWQNKGAHQHVVEWTNIWNCNP